MTMRFPGRRQLLRDGIRAGVGLATLSLVPRATRAAFAGSVAPAIDGDWWPVAGDPDLGTLTAPEQQPVDFAIWQAADGTWQLWSCIRHTRTAGNTRLFYRWQGDRITDRDWRPMGIAMQADASFGETPGGLQAPFVLKTGARYTMFYGDWEHICRATSVDGKTFSRQLGKDGKSGMFSNQPATGNTRDPMVIAIGGKYHCYTTSNPGGRGAVYCRISHDLESWDEERIVAMGGAAGDTANSAECPFVHFHKPSHRYVLFRTQRYGQDALTHVYCSPDPLDFGINDDRYLVGTLKLAACELVEQEGQTYIAALLPSLKGIQIARLRWVAR
jgi:hypothetical protein